MTTTNTYDIDAVAKQFNRIFPADVDRTPIDWGEGFQSGYCGSEPPLHRTGDPSVIGYFDDGGNVGHPIMEIDAASVQRAGEVLAGLDPAANAAVHRWKMRDIQSAFLRAGVKFRTLV